MDRAIAGANTTNELDLVGGDHFSARQSFLARATSAVHDFDRTRRRGYNAMTERRIQNDLGFEQEERGMLSQPEPEQNITASVEIQFLPQKGYRPSFHHGPRNAAIVGDVN